MSTHKSNTMVRKIAILCFVWLPLLAGAQITERPRPSEWDNLVEGARFIDRFLPMQGSDLSSDTWGAQGVVPRLIDNGLENRIWSYWGGNILKGNDGKYHLLACGWLENSPAGHKEWPKSYVFNSIGDSPSGPFKERNIIGRGHNPEAYQLNDGRYVLYVIDGRYITDDLNGKWEYEKFDFDPRDRKIVEGLSNLSFAKRDDGSFLMVCRGGGIWVSRDGLDTYNQITDGSVYPKVDGRFEDPVIWKDNVQYNMIVNDWYGRIAYYLRSKDGVQWVVDPGEAYMPGIAVHKDGSKEDWFKYERLKVFQDEHGRAVQANFAVIDTLKDEDKPYDRHSSKNITIPLNPGMLLSVLNSGPIGKNTKEIRVKVQAEPGFDPQSDLDLQSLRFGASSQVNYGGGAAVKSSEKSGRDLILVFDASACGISEDEFAPKMIGRDRAGKMVYGFARLPHVEYDGPILSGEAPVMIDKSHAEVAISNFGITPSGKAKVTVELEYKDGSKRVWATGDIPPLQPYQEEVVTLQPKFNVDLSQLDRVEKAVVTISAGKKHLSVLNTFLRADAPLRKAMTLCSPGNKVAMTISAPLLSAMRFGDVKMKIDGNHSLGETGILNDISLGLKTDRQNFSDNMRLVAVSDMQTVTDDYRMLTGKRSHCRNSGNERTYTFENNLGQIMDVTCRAYDDGIAFRYSLPDVEAGGERLTQECTSYPIPDGTKRWIQYYDPSSYEAFYPLMTDGGKDMDAEKARHWAYPVLIETADSVFALITEANLMHGHSASYLDNSSDPGRYTVRQGSPELPIKSGYTSPWRVVIAGTLADIVESTLVTDVSEPQKISDTSWIQPAPASWIYWAYNHGSKDYQIVKEYVDLGAKMNWPYVLIDWEWAEMENGGDIHDALAYAHDKGLKPLLWYNSSTNWIGQGAPTPLFRLNMPEDRKKEMQWLKDNGVAGIKIDFFKGDDVSTIDYYIDILEDAARYGILITFHGATIPRGWQRTYPHMMTVEGVYGAEWYNNGPTLTPKAAAHNCTLPFTRNVVGPMDYTPGTFSDSQHKHITSHGHELALPVLFESAIQHMPDRPDSYYSLPQEVKDLLASLPTAWDETRLLNGYPADHVVMARRKGDRWYIAGINGLDSPRRLNLDVSRLGLSGGKMRLFTDGADPHSFDISDGLDAKDMEIECLPRGGFVAVVE